MCLPLLITFFFLLLPLGMRPLHTYANSFDTYTEADAHTHTQTQNTLSTRNLFVFFTLHFRSMGGYWLNVVMRKACDVLSFSMRWSTIMADKKKMKKKELNWTERRQNNLETCVRVSHRHRPMFIKCIVRIRIHIRTKFYGLARICTENHRMMSVRARATVCCAELIQLLFIYDNSEGRPSNDFFLHFANSIRSLVTWLLQINRRLVYTIRMYLSFLKYLYIYFFRPLWASN